MPQAQYLSQDIHPEDQYASPEAIREVKGSVATTSTNVNEMQMIYDSQIGQFISIHDHEANIIRCDSMKFIDRNFHQSVEFTTISSKPSIEEPEEKTPWSNFWARKQRSNQLLLKAVSKGQKDVIQKLLNPL